MGENNKEWRVEWKDALQRNLCCGGVEVLAAELIANLLGRRLSLEWRRSMHWTDIFRRLHRL